MAYHMVPELHGRDLSRPSNRSSGSRGAERALGRIHQFAKQLLPFNRKCGQLLTVQIDPGLFQARDKAAVVHVVFAHERIDARDPQCAEVTLLLLAIAIGVGQPLFERIAGLPVKFAAADKAGGELELPFMAAAGFWPAFGAWNRGVLP